MQSLEHLWDEKWGCTDASYNSLLKSFGHENLLQVDDNDYQGDSRVLFRDGDKYGYLMFGWGSCSGCDALQGCSTLQQVYDLRDQLHRSMYWGTRDEMLAFFKTRDWETKYEWRAEETKRFVAEAIQILENSTAA